MRSTKPSPIFFVIAVCAFIPLVLFLGFRNTGEGGVSISRWGTSGHATEENEVNRAGNRTLGFGKVLVLGLKERSDKRDAIVLASSLTGFDVEFIDGVRGEEVVDKALPIGLNIKGGERGSWRGHMNAVRSILEGSLETILIMEDDMDWDARLLSQLPQFATGIRTLSHIPLSTPQSSPYGDDWDILYPGHCGEADAITADEPRHIIYNDETVAPLSNLTQPHLLKDYPDHTRIVHRGVQPICTFAYGISRRGAQKVLALMSQEVPGDMNGYWDFAFDLQLALACRHRLLGLKCWSVEPMLFYHHRSKGRVDRDSDIKEGGSLEDDKKGVREKGGTLNIVRSVRLNIERLIRGEGEWVLQW